MTTRRDIARAAVSLALAVGSLAVPFGCKRGGGPSGPSGEAAALAATKSARPGADKPKAAKAPRTTFALGTNLDSIKDWSSEWSFVDQFKASRSWISGSEREWDDHRPIDVDDNGWVRSLKPGQRARTLMLWEGVEAPAGDYVVLYDGEGTIEYAPGGKVARGKQRDVVTFDPRKDGFAITILKTSASNPVRNIRVLMPGGVCADEPAQACDDARPCARGACVPFEKLTAARRDAGTQAPEPLAESIFHPTFLSRTRGYRVLRFMDWMATNGSKQRRWDARPKPTDARWSEKGVPVEVMVALVNQLGVDPWFCMPHLADDDYVERFATYVRDHLQPGRKAYVEHSNEVWNGIFEQAAHARDQGRAAKLGDNDFQAQLHEYARRSTEVFKIWEKVFKNKSRLVRVLGSQASIPWASETMLSFRDTKANTDALAIAPYFGGSLGDADPKVRARVRGLKLDGLMAELRDKSLPESLGWVKEQAAVAGRFGVELVAYEGGQHLVLTGDVNDEVVNKLFDGANHDPRMKALYLDYFAGWRAAGGGLFVHFVNCARWDKWGRWGALESLLQPRAKSPKFDALQTLLEAQR